MPISAIIGWDHSRLYAIGAILASVYEQQEEEQQKKREKNALFQLAPHDEPIEPFLVSASAQRLV